MSLWCDDIYVTLQGYYVIKIITRLLHQGITRLLRHGDVDQSQTVSKSADFGCEKNAFLLIGVVRVGYSESAR